MPRIFIGLLAAAMLFLSSAGPVAAQTPLDPTGELTGFIPASQGMMACVRFVNKRVWVYPLQCNLMCAIKGAKTLQKGFTFDQASCLDSGTFACKPLYDKAMSRLDQSLCLGCLNQTAQEALYPEYQGVVNMVREATYCDANNSVPFPDGIGDVSLNRDITKCQDKVIRAVIKATKCLNPHCHQKTAEALFWGKPVNNAACEYADPVHSCKARFEASSAKIVGCPPCLNAAARTAIYDQVQEALDTNNGDIYCAD